MSPEFQQILRSLKRLTFSISTILIYITTNHPFSCRIPFWYCVSKCNTPTFRSTMHTRFGTLIFTFHNTEFSALKRLIRSFKILIPIFHFYYFQNIGINILKLKDRWFLFQIMESIFFNDLIQNLKSRLFDVSFFIILKILELKNGFYSSEN